MSNRMAPESLEAYREKVRNGSIKSDKLECFKLIDEKGPITMKAMEPFMNKNKHKFSGRIRELKDEGVICKTDTKNGHQVLEVDSEWVSASKNVETEDVSGLFVEDKQSDSLEPGDVIYG